jgi:hypothetical protein
MAHWQIPTGTHSKSSGNLFIWNTTDNNLTTSDYKVQVGTYSGGYNIYNGAWKKGGPPGQYTDNVQNLPGNGAGLYVRALYKKPGSTMTYNTTPVPFTCTP